MAHDISVIMIIEESLGQRINLCGESIVNTVSLPTKKRGRKLRKVSSLNDASTVSAAMRRCDNDASVGDIRIKLKSLDLADTEYIHKLYHNTLKIGTVPVLAVGDGVRSLNVSCILLLLWCSAHTAAAVADVQLVEQKYAQVLHTHRVYVSSISPGAVGGVRGSVQPDRTDSLRKLITHSMDTLPPHFSVLLHLFAEELFDHYCPSLGTSSTHACRSNRWHMSEGVFALLSELWYLVCKFVVEYMSKDSLCTALVLPVAPVAGGASSSSRFLSVENVSSSGGHVGVVSVGQVHNLLDFLHSLVIMSGHSHRHLWISTANNENGWRNVSEAGVCGDVGSSEAVVTVETDSLANAESDSDSEDSCEVRFDVTAVNSGGGNKGDQDSLCDVLEWAMGDDAYSTPVNHVGADSDSDSDGVSVSETGLDVASDPVVPFADESLYISPLNVAGTPWAVGVLPSLGTEGATNNLSMLLEGFLVGYCHASVRQGGLQEVVINDIHRSLVSRYLEFLLLLLALHAKEEHLDQDSVAAGCGGLNNLLNDLRAHVHVASESPTPVRVLRSCGQGAAAVDVLAAHGVVVMSNKGLKLPDLSSSKLLNMNSVQGALVTGNVVRHSVRIDNLDGFGEIIKPPKHIKTGLWPNPMTVRFGTARARTGISKVKKESGESGASSSSSGRLGSDSGSYGYRAAALAVAEDIPEFRPKSLDSKPVSKRPIRATSGGEQAPPRASTRVRRERKDFELELMPSFSSSAREIDHPSTTEAKTDNYGPSAYRYAVGERVLATWGGQSLAFLPGSITAAQATGTYNLEFDDGLVWAGAVASHIMPLVASSEDLSGFAPGVRVVATRDDKTSEYYRGKIARVYVRDATYRFEIEYDAGDCAELTAKHIRLVPPGTLGWAEAPSPGQAAPLPVLHKPAYFETRAAMVRAAGGEESSYVYIVGDRVFSTWDGNAEAFFPGTVAEVNENDTYDIDYDDWPSSRGVSPKQLMPLTAPGGKLSKYVPGARVIAVRDGKPEELFPGVIQCVYTSGTTFEVAYDEGDCAELSAEHIWVVPRGTVGWEPLSLLAPDDVDVDAVDSESDSESEFESDSYSTDTDNVAGATVPLTVDEVESLMTDEFVRRLLIENSVSGTVSPADNPVFVASVIRALRQRCRWVVQSFPPDWVGCSSSSGAVEVYSRELQTQHSLALDNYSGRGVHYFVGNGELVGAVVDELMNASVAFSPADGHNEEDVGEEIGFHSVVVAKYLRTRSNSASDVAPALLTMNNLLPQFVWTGEHNSKLLMLAKKCKRRYGSIGLAGWEAIARCIPGASAYECFEQRKQLRMTKTCEEDLEEVMPADK